MLLYHALHYGLIAIILAMIAASTAVGIVSANNGYWATALANPRLMDQLKVTVLLINNFVGAKVYCLKLALLCLC